MTPQALMERINAAIQNRLTDRDSSLDTRLHIANHPLSVSFCSDELRAILLPAIRILEEPTSERPTPALTSTLGTARIIALVDDELFHDFDPDMFGDWARADVSHARFIDDPRCLAIHSSSDETMVLTYFDKAAQVGAYICRSGISASDLERVWPMIRIFEWWGEAHGMTLVHAGAVGTATGGLLLVGRGGSGKSSAVLAALGERLRYLGDDSVILDACGNVHALYSSVRLWPEMIDRFRGAGLWSELEWRWVGEKPTAWIQNPEDMLSQCPVRAIVLPRVGGTPGISPCSRTEALRSLAPSTLANLSSNPEQSFRVLGDLVARVPAYWLTLTEDLSLVRDTLEALLSDLNGDAL